MKLPPRLLNTRQAILYIVAALLASIAVISAPFLTATARASVQGWNAGNIISDNVFTNKDALSVAEIQTFLNSKVPVCDTWGTQSSEFGGGTRRQWAEARGHSPPYTCLKDYSQNGKSSAQLIHDAAQKYSINPQVLIVLLQKEQGLVTDAWPVTTQYRSATGYGCPDTAPCDSQYYGLANQLEWAAKMFRAIMNASPTWYTPYVVGNNYIRYSPTESCGGTTVRIQNRATQALYNYTPYQPNQAALNAGWGTAHCGAYGNRNFYLYFTNWFGTTRGPAYAWKENTSIKYYSDNTKQTAIDYNNIERGQYFYVEYSVQNTGYQTWRKNSVLIGRNSSSPFCTTEWIACARAAVVNKGVDVAPGESVNFGYWMRAPLVTGRYQVEWNLLIENVAWFADIGSHQNIRVTAPPQERQALSAQKTFMKRGDVLYSPDTSSVLSLLNTGELAIYSYGEKVHTIASGVHELRQQSDGNLVAYTSKGSVRWAIGDGQQRTLTMTNSELQYKSASNNISVASWDIGNKTVREYLVADSVIYKNQRIQSDNKQYRLVLQGDGNLVQYGPRGAMWAVGANKGEYLVQQGDGKLVLYDYNGRPIWGSPVWSPNGATSATYVQGDGNIVTYINYRPVWATR